MNTDKKLVKKIQNDLKNIRQTNKYLHKIEIQNKLNLDSTSNNYLFCALDERYGKELDSLEANYIKLADNSNYNLTTELNKNYSNLLTIGIKLNSKLKKPIKFFKLLSDIKEQIHITTKEFALLYGYSKSSQASYRGRINNPLPFLKDESKGKSSNTKILYSNEEVKQWFNNNF